MPPKKKKIKKIKKDPKSVNQSVKQSVVIKIGDIPVKKKRSYTKRAYIGPKKDVPIGPVNIPQPQLMLQPQRVEPVSRLDPSIEKLKMSVSQFDDLSKQTNDLLQRISRTNLIQAHEQIKSAPIVESLIEQPFQTPEPKTKAKQLKITEFMTPQYTRLEPQFSNPLKLSTTPQSLNDFFESPVEPPNTGSKVGLTIPQTTDRKLILEEPDDDEQVSAPELSAGAGEEATIELSPGIVQTSSEPIPYRTEVLVKGGAGPASGAGPAEEPTKTMSEAEILAESKAIKARQKEEKAQTAEATKQSKAEAFAKFELERQEKAQREADAAYEVLKANNGVFPPRVGRPTQAQENAMARWKFEARQRQAEAIVDVPVSEPGTLSPDPAGGIITLNEALGTGPTAPGLDKLLDVPIALPPTPASTAELYTPSLAESTKKGAGRPPGSKGKTDEEKEAERAEHRAEVQRILGILRTNSGIYVSGKRGPPSQAENAARLAYTNETTAATSKIKARVDAKKK